MAGWFGAAGGGAAGAGSGALLRHYRGRVYDYRERLAGHQGARGLLSRLSQHLERQPAAGGGGRATVFVNNQYLESGRVTLDDLRSLQDDFGWEIGTHTFQHQNAIRHVQVHGLESWLGSHLARSLDELRGAGLQVSNLVFPFNAYTPEIAAASRAAGIASYRRADPYALGSGLRPDGSLPGTSFDLTRHVPLEVLMQWIDMAHTRGQLLFLYGHRILPDEAFVTGRVAEVRTHAIVAGTGVVLPKYEDVVLVPHLGRRGTTASIGGLKVAADGRTIIAPEGSHDLTRLTTPGATFLIGPAYGTRMSDFTNLLNYAAERITFYTVADIVAGRHEAAASGSVPSALPGAGGVGP